MNLPDATPWLSVLVPVHNAAAYIEACVRSILDQRVDGVEILLMDDASGDGSPAILTALANRHPDRVRVYLRDVNAGVSAARNALLAQARGRYVWFIDADDLVLDGAVESLRRVVDAHAPDLVLCDYRVVRADFGLKHRLRGELHRRTFAGPTRTLLRDRSLLVEGLLKQGQLHPWSKIATRSVWNAAPFPVGRYFEDIAVIAGLVSTARNYIHVPETWIGYRQHSASIMRTLGPAKMLDLNQSLGELYAGLCTPANELTERATFAVDYFCLKTYASLARRFKGGLCQDRPDVLDACREGVMRMFPAGVGPVLAQCRQRGWWLRARRARVSLRRMGWLDT